MRKQLVMPFRVMYCDIAKNPNNAILNANQKNGVGKGGLNLKCLLGPLIREGNT